MVLLQSSQNRANSNIVLPLVGNVTFNEESIISVEDHETANELISMVPFLDFKIVGAQETGEDTDTDDKDKIKKKSEEDELNPKEEGDEIGGGDKEGDSLPTPSLKDQLNAANLAQLKEFAEILTKEDESVKKSDWSKKNKAELLEFLLDKIE